MKNHKKSKQQKIDFLIALSQGKTTIDSILPTTYQVWNKKSNTFYGPQKSVLSEAQFKALNQPGVKYILVSRVNKEKTDTFA